jgi:DNA polymerase elongation subunit (family B)
MSKKTGPRILILDIETLPMVTYNWGLYDQNIPLNMIKDDWTVLSWAAKWLDDPPSKIMYADQKGVKNIRNDKGILKKMHALMDEADVIIGQNSDSFDIKKLNARFVINGLPPPTTYKKIDTKKLAKKHFAFTSNGLEYMSDKLNKKYKKLKHGKYPGIKLWLECMAGNKEAFVELKKYNIHDVLATEELYQTLVKWDTATNFNVYIEAHDPVCTCGSTRFKFNGYKYLESGKYNRYKCLECGKESRGKENLLSKEKRKAMRK